jgi:hypothetical protein
MSLNLTTESAQDLLQKASPDVRELILEVTNKAFDFATDMILVSETWVKLSTEYMEGKISASDVEEIFSGMMVVLVPRIADVIEQDTTGSLLAEVSRKKAEIIMKLSEMSARVGSL